MSNIPRARERLRAIIRKNGLGLITAYEIIEIIDEDMTRKKPRPKRGRKIKAKRKPVPPKLAKEIKAHARDNLFHSRQDISILFGVDLQSVNEAIDGKRAR